MRIKTMLQTTAVLGLAVVAGLLGVGGTWALWNVSASAQGGTVQSAHLDVKINGSSAFTTRAVQLGRPSGALAPDSPVYSSFRITNQNNAGSDLRIEAAFGTPSVRTNNTELKKQLDVDLAVKPQSGTCSAARFGDLQKIEVGQNHYRDLCVRYSLKDDDSRLSGLTAAVTIQVTATQIPSATT